MRYKCLNLFVFGLVFLVGTNSFGDEKQTYFQVMGGSTQQPNEIRPWSSSAPTREEAEVLRDVLERSYKPGGLLESAPDKPINLFIAEFSSTGAMLNGKPQEPVAAQLSVGRGSPISKPELKTVDVGPLNKPELKGRKYVGEINGDQVTLDFGDGEVQFTGERAGAAKYSVLITKIMIQSERTRYNGTIAGNRISGTFERLDGSEKGSWSVTLVDRRVFDFVGTFMSGAKGSYDGYEEFVLKENGTGVFTHKGQGTFFEKYSIRWTVNADGQAVLTGWTKLEGDPSYGYRPIDSVRYKRIDDSIVRLNENGQPSQNYRPYNRQ